MMNTLHQNRRGQTRATALWLATVVLVATALQLWLSTDAQAQDKAERLQITSFSLENLDQQGKGAVLKIKTRDGRPIPKDQILYHTRGDVLRITFKDVPLEPQLGLDVSFPVDAIRGVKKGYALKENNWQSFARLKFDGDATEALKNSKIVAVDGGVELMFPFGATIAPTPAPTPAPIAQAKAAPTQNNKDEGAFGWAKPTQGESMAKGTDNTIAQAKIDQDDMADMEAPIAAAPTLDKPQQTHAAPIAAAPAITQGTPLELADAERGPTLGRVAGGLAIVALLLIALAFAWRRLQEIKARGGSLKVPVDGVRVLSTYNMGRQARVMVMDVLGEVLVVGQGTAGMSLLHRLEKERVKELQKTPKSKLSEDESLDLLGKLLETTPSNAKPLDTETRVALEHVAANEGSLEDLSRSLDKEISQEEKPLMRTEAPEPTRSRIGRRIAAAQQQLEQAEAPVSRSIRTSARNAAASDDLEPVDFQEIMRRRQSQQIPTQDLQAPTGRGQAKATRPSDEIVSIRDRARSLGRL